METNQSTYLTAVNIKVSKSSNQITDISTQKIPKITNNISITPENDTYFSLPQKMETRNQIVEFLKYSSQRSNLLKTEFMNFLLKDENFSGMNESEKFLREKAINNINIINKNNLEITKKKEEYEKIISELNREINNNIQTKSEQQEKLYIHKKEELQNKIKDKNHEFSVFQNTYKEEYKERYLIIQKQKNEVQNIRINQKQFEKYNILNKKIIFEVNQKENLLSDVKKYIDQSRKIFTEEINTKTKTYKDLELEVQILKQSTESIEKSINLIIDKQKKVSKLIEEQIENNNYIKNSLDNVSNEYFNNHMILLKNTEMCNMNLDDLIMNYNEKKNKMNKLRKDLYNANQQITYLNENLNKLNKEYNEKKEENKKIIKQQKNKKKNKEKSILNINKKELLLKDKIINNKNKIKDLKYILNSKTNFLILCLKFLFESGNFLYKAYDSSRIEFYFNLSEKKYFVDEIIKSKYYELINIEQKYFDKIFTSDTLIFNEPKKLLIFCIKIFLFFNSATEVMASNILNLSCFSSEDIIEKFPLSQLKLSIFNYKNNKTDDKKGESISKSLEIKKGTNKVEIINILSNENKKVLQSHLSKNCSLLSKKKEIMSRSVEDLIKINHENNNELSTDINSNKNIPKKMYFNFLKNNKLPNKIKNSRYIKNHPSSSLLSLKRFFTPEEQKQYFGKISIEQTAGFEDKITRNKLAKRSFDSSNNNLTFIKSPLYRNKLKFKKIQNIDDSYLAKEYMYEIEIDDYQEKIQKKKFNRNDKSHILKYSAQDPQKQLIFSRMMDIRNLELQSSNTNNRSINANEITDSKINENKFYEMYDKFKKKYFYNPKKITNTSKVKNNRKKIEYSPKSNTNLSNHINMKKGIKFIRNNSDFFYGVKGESNIKNKIKKFQLPNIKTRVKNLKKEND